MGVTKMDIKPGDGVIINGYMMVLAAPGYLIVSAEPFGKVEAHDCHSISFKSATIRLMPPNWEQKKEEKK